MIRNIFQDASPFVKVIFSLFIMLVSFLLVFFVGLLIIMPFIDASFSDILSIYSNLETERNIIILKYIQALNTVGLFIVPPFVISYLLGYKAGNYLKLNFRSKTSILLIVIVIMIFSLPVINLLAVLNEKMSFPDFLSGLEQRMKLAEENAKYITEIFVNVSTIPNFIINIIVIALLPAIGEELVFRGLFQHMLTKWTKNKHLGIILAAFLFSAFHLQFYGFLPRMLMGVMFGYFLLWTNSIWIPILAHFVNNATAVTFYYLYNIGVVKMDIENIGAEEKSYVYFIFSSILLTGLLIIMRRIAINKT